MKLIKKTALAVAISAAAAPAFSGDLAFTGTGETVVLANIIFGEGSPGVGSEETLITAPETTFDIGNAGADGDNGSVASAATVKFTLGGGAIFGEDLSTTALVDNANGGVGVFSLTAVEAGATAVSYEVVQGGAIGDNTITFEITFGDADDVVEDVTFVGYKVKNLTSALMPSSANPRVQLGVEYVESVDTTADNVTGTDTDAPLTIFGSQEPLELTAGPVDFDTAPFTRINVGSGELTFTGGTADGRSDFDVTGDATRVALGTLQLERTTISAADFPNGDVGGFIKKENGDDFDFQGGDSHALAINVGSGSLQANVGSDIFLSTDASCATEVSDITFTGESLTAAGYSATISGTTTALTTSHTLCYVADGADQIPEAGEITATWSIDFFNTRYDNRDLNAGNYGPLLRNGCVASFFNIPATTNGTDTAYIRLTNTSSTNSGDIRGTLYAQDGTILGEDVTIAPDLAIHATQIFSTEGSDRTTGAGQDIFDIETAFGIAPGDYLGRGRLVLKGAFDTCEGMGLIRNSATGALYNMTSTTQGNEAASPNDGNNAN